MCEALTSTRELAGKLDLASTRVIDCRYSLLDSEAGHAAYLEAHVPGACYANLETDLSGPATTDTGRHPLPPPARLREVFGALGIGATSEVFVYDDAFGMVAARMWWMLRYMGHERVALLNGGWPAWVAEGRPIRCGDETGQTQVFTGEPRLDRLVVLDAIDGGQVLLDAREPARYRGENEPIDPRAGHIPGARNHYWQTNIGADGKFCESGSLRKQFRESLGILPDADTVHYCGSGVSACHNVLAQILAGFPEPRLYCGSWSEWSGDATRPAATGGEAGR